jgi:D-3-phosphoglycerate dehydrogenase
MHESLFPMMEEIGWEAHYFPDITKEEIKVRHHGYDGLIVRSKVNIDGNLLGNNPTLKFVGRAGAGLDNIDLAYMKDKGIQVIHASEGNRDAVGEYTLGALLSLMRNIPQADAEVREGKWEREKNRGEEIMGKTVGIIGYGNMGHAFAKRLSGFACNVLAYDKYKKNFSDHYVQEVELQELFEHADILSLHIPLTDETRFMVDKNFFQRFKKKIIVVNTARGEIIPLADMAAALDEGKVRGAVLDVLENEKLNTLTAAQQAAFNNLKNRSNVIFTPHIAGWTFESHVKINVALVSKIKELIMV